jgi:hypothetical protein
LIGVHLGWAVIACYEFLLIGPITGNAIRVDLVLLLPVVWLLILTQVVVLSIAFLAPA